MSGAESGHHTSTLEPASLQGLAAALADDASRIDILEKAFDFRGDCTITLADGRTITGYIFDRRRAPTARASVVRMMTATSDDRLCFSFADITKVDFGKDAAAGKSFETWLRKYVETKRRGGKASIESEPLEA